MRIILVIILVFSSLITVAQNNSETSAISPELLFQQANQAYQEGDFAQALTQYKTILNAGKTSCELHYNIANTYFRLDSLGKAILHYEKAIKINPSHQKAIENLDFSNDFITQKAGIWPDLFYNKWLRSIVGLLSAWMWFLFAVIFVWLALFFGKKYVEAAAEKQQKLGFYSAISCLVLSVLFIIFGFSRYIWQADDSYAIVTTELLQVKNGPADNSKDMFKISEGNKLQIVEVTPEGWCKIQLPDGQQGWMHQRDLERI